MYKNLTSVTTSLLNMNEASCMTNAMLLCYPLWLQIILLAHLLREDLTDMKYASNLMCMHEAALTGAK